MQDSRNYYKILEVSPGATQQEIKKAYRRLVRQYHPDLHPNNPEATERFRAICEAYQVLSDGGKRRQYDREVQPQPNPPKTESTTAQDFYVRAVSKALAKNYQGAVKDCNQAISRNPNFVEAYVERGAAYYKLGNARETLQDCNQALRINSQFAPAYYY
ncbi:MAG: DnaJ domain-containing protein, partial [Coleofasciculus sp. C2-GNP5-27]